MKLSKLPSPPHPDRSGTLCVVYRCIDPVGTPSLYPTHTQQYSESEYAGV